ncbi:hypothetical protein XFF6991_180183 [Xanthomonas phaseoli pv. phaseoli]|uniref:Uncharacterized protein n=1 Tax=Xanthomonas campestris pv. phaseoli TaxID=317013 RepID=A0A7Z7IWU1_XANCH|nr:hypothetical protein XFF6991_180183 [Xanthomonas phaseoli pv. phaseoli]
MTDANLRAMVESATGSSLLIQQVTGSGTTASLANPHRANLLFRVVFKDGSYVGLIVDVNRANGKSEPGSERTAAGQSIPKPSQRTSGHLDQQRRRQPGPDVGAHATPWRHCERHGVCGRRRHNHRNRVRGSALHGRAFGVLIDRWTTFQALTTAVR